MSGFTPGPWEVDDYGSGVKTLAEGLNPSRIHGYGAGNDFICDLNDGEYHEYFDREEQEANARLISAAPDLLEALKYARRMVDQNHTDVAYIDAAIAKATGDL